MRSAPEGVRSRAPVSVQFGCNDVDALAYRELRIQHRGEPYRVLYAFDPRRTAILLLGGKKTGDPRWYDTAVPIADRLYDEYIAELKREGLLDD